MMDIECFTSMLLKRMREECLPIVNVERLPDNRCVFLIEMSDKSKFFLEIGERDDELKANLAKVNIIEHRIHEIYEKYINSLEYDEIRKNNDFNIDWLDDILEVKDYRKLEKDIFEYSQKNDELLFTLGFKYAWSLFHECMENVS